MCRLSSSSSSSCVCDVTELGDVTCRRLTTDQMRVVGGRGIIQSIIAEQRALASRHYCRNEVLKRLQMPDVAQIRRKCFQPLYDYTLLCTPRLLTDIPNDEPSLFTTQNCSSRPSYRSDNVTNFTR